MAETQPKPKRRRRIWRILGWLMVIFLIVLTICLIFLGEIIEWQVEKRDFDYTGRQIDLEDVDVNILRGCAQIEGLTFYEADGVSPFISARHIIADINPWQLFRKRLVVEEVGLDRVIVRVSHEYQVFNYDDLLDTIATYYQTTEVQKENDESPSEWWWGASNIHIDSCRFEYRNIVLESTITADPFNLDIPNIQLGTDTFSMHSNLGFIKGGTVDLDIVTNLKEQTYDLDLLIEEVAFDYLYLYLRDYLKVADFGGFVSSDIHAEGSIKDVEEVTVSGSLGIHDMRILDNDLDTVFALGEFEAEIDHYANGRDSFDFGNIIAVSPYIRFELYPEGDNLTDLLAFDIPDNTETDSIVRAALPGRDYFNVFIYLADYVSKAVEKYQNSSYRIDSIGIFNGTILYSDYTLDQEAVFLLSNASMTGGGLSTESDRVEFDIGSDINNIGRFDAHWSFDPRDVLEMELQMVTRNFLVSSISPYSFQYTGYPFTYGDALFEGTITIKDRRIESSNHLFVEDMEVGRKGFADPPVKLPVRLAVSILKDLDGNIDLDIPVSGNIDDPEFDYWPAVWKVLKNTLLKVATAPYRLFAGMFKVDEDDLRNIPWVYGQEVVEKDQVKRTKSIAKVLDGKPELALTYTPVDNIEKEIDYIAMFATKEQFYREEITGDLKGQLTGKDTIAIGKINPTDSLFYAYLREKANAEELMTSSEMARVIVGVDSLRSNVQNRIVTRERLFKSLLIDDNGVNPDRIIRMPMDSLETKPDTFNLVGPNYFLGFKLYEAGIDSIQRVEGPPVEQER